ncbi:carbohydrate ABC transporter permease [Phytohabitans aurantiacus]|jgi:multiple sugar transport system permease protein|uniref:Sugar ABC transporter permease n=1 Tax=Phytohabitans aurantiacus TaxID=3016789 RepID=A0ABQ5QPA1_9ACTN|nr:sugar ABC transporter permease [Phytohabitans aurantiacus]GLH95731.1 sugar ABC transporter permease [Phytohabitans aurantiacus]
MRLRRSAVGWSFALPFAALFAVFLVGPVLASLAMSFTDIRSADVRSPLAVTFLGFDNYVRLFQDEQFVKAAGNTLVVVLLGLPLTVVLGMAAALGLNSGLVRFRAIFRVGYYLPVVTSIVAISVVWRFLLQPDTGLLNSVLGLVGIEGPNWLANTSTALPAVIMMIVWRGIGFQMVIFLAGLQAIPGELYEAARIDGASRWAQFWHVTVPSLRPTLLFVTVIGSIGLLQVFEEPFVMTRGGPLGSTTTVAYSVYSQFSFGNYGYASAMSYVLFLAVVLLSILWFRLLRSDEVG